MSFGVSWGRSRSATRARTIDGQTLSRRLSTVAGQLVWYAAHGGVAAGLSFSARGFVTYQAFTNLPAFRRLNITRAEVVAVARETMRPRIIAAATRGNGPIEERLVASHASLRWS